MKRPEYLTLVETVRATVEALVPSSATVAIATRGDDRLLAVSSRARHFPSDDKGGYAGTYPATGAEAKLLVERARRDGANYLVFPSTTRWWLEHYDGLEPHLRQYPILNDDRACLIYELMAPREDPSTDLPDSDPRNAYVLQHIDALIRSLTPPGAGVALLTDQANASSVTDRRVHAIKMSLHPRRVLLELNTLRRTGTMFAVIPASWAPRPSERLQLDRHLRTDWQMLAERPGVCAIYRVADSDG